MSSKSKHPPKRLSPAQDLAAAAEKLGIKCPAGDYTPLLAYLVIETVPHSVKAMVREAENKAEGVAILHDFGLMHDSTGGRDVCHEADPGGLTITRPIRRRLKWPEVWELIALDTMQRASAWLPEKEKKSGPSRTPAPTGEIVPAWRTGTPTREGRYMCRAEIVDGKTDEYTACEWKDGGWWLFDRPAFKNFKVVGWWPLPDNEE